MKKFQHKVELAEIKIKSQISNTPKTPPKSISEIDLTESRRSRTRFININELQSETYKQEKKLVRTALEMKICIFIRSY